MFKHEGRRFWLRKLDFDAAREGQKKETRAKTEKGAVGKIGGRKRAAPGRERAANEKGREGAS